MYKSILIVTLLIISGCSVKKTAVCKLEQEDSEVLINIEADNDDITSIEVFESFILPYDTLADENEMKQIYEQISSAYTLNDNRLTKQYSIKLDKKYSYNLTIENLKKEHFYCE